MTERLLSALAREIYNQPARILVATLLLAALTLAATVRFLQFSTDRTDLLDPNQGVQRTWQRFKAEFGKTADFVVLVQGDPVRRQAAVDELAARLLEDSATFDSVFYRLDLPALKRHSLYFLSLADLERMRRELSVAAPWLRALAAPDGLSELLARMAQPRAPQETARELEPVLPLLNRLLGQLAHSLESRGSNVYHSPLGDFQPEVTLVPGRVTPGQTVFYTQLADGSAHVLVVRARERSGSYGADVAALNRLRGHIAGIVRHHPEASIHLSGEPVINTDEMRGASRDALNSAALAVVCVNVLLTAAFGAFLRPQMVIVGLLVGLSWSFGFASVTVGRLNLITVNFATILVGLGMTFGIHLLYRYAEERAQGAATFPALERTLVDGGRENLVGALTTSVAFYALYFTSFRSAGELGLITGTGVLLCFFSMITVLPALLILQERSDRTKGEAPPLAHMETLGAIEEWLHERPIPILIASFLFTVYSLTLVPYIPFDYNLLHMQPRDADAIRVEGYLQKAGYSTLYAISVARTPEEAARLTAAFQALPTVSRVESVASLLPLATQQKQPIVEDIIRLAKTLQVPHLTPPRSADQLLKLREHFKAMKASLEGALPLIRGDQARQLTRLLDRLESELDTMGPGAVEEGLNTFEQRLVDDLTLQLSVLKAQEPGLPDLLGQLPGTLKLRSVGRSGVLAIRIFPRGDAWEREPLERFVRQLQAVDPEITGTPVLIYYYLEELRHAYNVSGRNALIVICVLLLVHFRSVKRAGLALFPKLLGIVWMLGVMGTLGIDFNAANFMALPLTLGIGLIFGVHVLQQSEGPRSLFQGSTGPAILLSALTTIIGFATLLAAAHRGVASLGLVMAVGVGANLVTSVVVLPALLQAVRGRSRTG